MYKKKTIHRRAHISRFAAWHVKKHSLRHIENLILMEVLLVVDLLAVLGLPQLPNRMKVRRITQDS